MRAFFMSVMDAGIR